MNEFKETSAPQEASSIIRGEPTLPKLPDVEIPNTQASPERMPPEADRPHIPQSPDILESPLSYVSDVFGKIFEKFGLVDTPSSEESQTDQTDTTDETAYAPYLEKREDGKYYDRETGKAYDSVDTWRKAQETLAKRYEGAADYYTKKAATEWARYKNAEANGESDVKTWEHYLLSQKYYAKAAECKESADAIRARLADTASSENTKVDSTDGVVHNNFVDAVPPERQKAVLDMYNDAPDSIKHILKKYGEGLIIEDTADGEICHYDLNDMVIRMEPNLDDEEYSEVLSHEFGHMVDSLKGLISCSPEFRNAIQSDLAKYDLEDPEGRNAFFAMMDEVFESDAAYDRAVTDILSAYFKNDPLVITPFYDSGIPFYSHPDEYWEMDTTKELEIYANCFSMFTQNNKESCEFMQKCFPNTWNQFMDTL